jgi:hypothetical protein
VTLVLVLALIVVCIDLIAAELHARIAKLERKDG